MKYNLDFHHAEKQLSCPSRGTWIEMEVTVKLEVAVVVVPLAGHVD